MFTQIVTDRQLAEVVVKYTSATAKDLRRLSNIATIAAEIKYEQETGKIAAAPAPTRKYECTCGFVGLRHTPACPTYPLTEEGGHPGYPPGGGDDDSDLD